MKMELNYNFHDSVIVSAGYADNRFTLILQLYEIFYPGKQQVKFMFSGIFNAETVSLLSKKLNAFQDDDDWIGARINALKFDEKKPSKENDLYFFLDVDWFDPVRIHCRQINCAEINHQ